MSVDASININLAKHDFQVSSFEIVKILTKNGSPNPRQNH